MTYAPQAFRICPQAVHICPQAGHVCPQAFQGLSRAQPRGAVPDSAMGYLRILVAHDSSPRPRRSDKIHVAHELFFANFANAHKKDTKTPWSRSTYVQPKAVEPFDTTPESLFNSQCRPLCCLVGGWGKPMQASLVAGPGWAWLGLGNMLVPRSWLRVA